MLVSTTVVSTRIFRPVVTFPSRSTRRHRAGHQPSASTFPTAVVSGPGSENGRSPRRSCAADSEEQSSSHPRLSRSLPTLLELFTIDRSQSRRSCPELIPGAFRFLGLLEALWRNIKSAALPLSRAESQVSVWTMPATEIRVTRARRCAACTRRPGHPSLDHSLGVLEKVAK